MAGSHPSQGIVDPSGTLLYFTNFGSNRTSVVEIRTRRVLAAIPVGASPDALALTPDARYLLVLDSGSNDLAVVDTAVRALFTLVPLGLSPRDLAIKVFRGAPQPPATPE